MKIGIFVGTFDPINNYHILSGLSAKKQYNLSQIWFCAYGENKTYGDYLFRVKLIKRAINAYRHFFVKDFLMQNNDNLSLLAKYLVEKYPNDQFIIFSDENQAERTLFNVKFSKLDNDEICYYSDEKILNKMNNFLLDNQMVREGKFNYCKKVNRTLMIESGFYADSIIKSMLKENRYLHSLSVAKLSYDIALKNNLDTFKAYLIGMYHDIAKNISNEDSEFFINIHKPYEASYPYQVYHQYNGEYLLHHFLNMKDKTILKAIRHHCLGDDKDIYSMIIYIADKLDPSRGYDSSKEIELSYHNIEKCFEIVKQQSKEFREKEGK